MADYFNWNERDAVHARTRAEKFREVTGTGSRHADPHHVPDHHVHLCRDCGCRFSHRRSLFNGLGEECELAVHSCPRCGFDVRNEAAPNRLFRPGDGVTMPVDYEGWYGEKGLVCFGGPVVGGPVLPSTVGQNGVSDSGGEPVDPEASPPQ